jgi:hypothetical protein
MKAHDAQATLRRWHYAAPTKLKIFLAVYYKYGAPMEL